MAAFSSLDKLGGRLSLMTPWEWGKIALPYLLGILAFVTLWEWASTRIHPLFFPSPARVVSEAVSLLEGGILLDHVGASLTRILIGFALGSAVGVPVGLLVGVSPVVRRMLEPYIHFFRFIPPIAMIVFALAWFGTGEGSKFFLIFFATVFIVTVSAEAGVHYVVPNRLRGALCLGATPVQLFFRVILPSCVPHILTGMRIAMGNAFATIVAAEMLAAESGIGFLLASARLFMKTDRIFVSIVTLGVVGFCTDRLFRLLTDRLWARYRG